MKILKKENIKKNIDNIKYQIDNQIEPSGNWQSDTLNSILNNTYQITSWKNDLNMTEQEYKDRYKEYFGYSNIQSYDEFIKDTQNSIDKAENTNKVLWKSLENNTPDYKIT